MLMFCVMDKMFSVFTNIVVVSFVHEVYMHATRYIEEINYTHTHKGMYHESGRRDLENY
jgi:hypothetical protein